MFQSRPNIPRPIKRGEPITADFLNGIYSLAGYFEGLPFDPTRRGPQFYLGRSVPVRIETTDFKGDGSKAWDEFDGAYYGVRMAAVIPGATNVFQAIETNQTDVFPAAILPLATGANVSALAVGDFCMAFPVSTEIGTVFILQPGGSGSGKLYRVSDNSVVIADRQWTYSLTPQALSTDGITYTDDTEGTVLTGVYNEYEALNSAGDTIQGNSVDFSLAPFGTTTGTLAKKLQPIKDKTLVRIVNTTYDTTGSASIPIYWFSAQNIVQEACIE